MKGWLSLKCYFHNFKDAVGICKKCGIAICYDCGSLINKQFLCKNCLDTKPMLETKELISTKPNKENSDLENLINNFDFYLKESEKIFLRNWSEGIKSHIIVIDKIRSNSPQNIISLLRSQDFLKDIYNVLLFFGMNSRGAKLKSFEYFASTLTSNIKTIGLISNFELESITDIQLQEAKPVLKELFYSLDIMESSSKLVGFSKTMAHIIPDLIPPIDRQNINNFFFGNTILPTYSYGEFNRFWNIFLKFQYISKKLQLSKHNRKFEGFNSSIPKIIDNAIWGYVYNKKKNIQLETNSLESLNKDLKPKSVLQILNEFLKILDNKFTKDEIKNLVKTKYPEINISTLERNIYFCTVNNIGRVNWSYNKKEREYDAKYDLLFKIKDNILEKYNPIKHGKWSIVNINGKFSVKKMPQ